MRTAQQTRGLAHQAPGEWFVCPTAAPLDRYVLAERGCAVSLLHRASGRSKYRQTRPKRGSQHLPGQRCPPALTFICLFMVIQKSMMKYITRMGQNTGTLKASKKVQAMATRMPLVAACLKVGEEVSATSCPAIWGHGSIPTWGSRGAVCVSYRVHSM